MNDTAASTTANDNVRLSFVDCFQSSSCVVQLLSGLQLALIIKPQRIEENEKNCARWIYEMFRIDLIFCEIVITHTAHGWLVCLSYGLGTWGETTSVTAVVTMLSGLWLLVVSGANTRPADEKTTRLFHLETWRFCFPQEWDSCKDLWTQERGYGPHLEWLFKSGLTVKSERGKLLRSLERNLLVVSWYVASLLDLAT